MEFTPEQQSHIDNLLAQSKSGLYTEEDLTKRVTSEVDRRVESGIQKGLDTHKSKWETEFSERAKLTAEELAQKELQAQLGELTARELAVKKKANTLDAKDMLSSASIPKSQYEKFIGLLISDDETVTKSNVENFINTFNETKVAIEADIKKQYSQVTPPSGGNADNPVTKETFNQLGYADKLKLKASNPELFKQFMDK